MHPEELLKMLQDGGMDDDSIKKLLTDTMAVLDRDFADADMKSEEEEKAEAGRLLGVAL